MVNYLLEKVCEKMLSKRSAVFDISTAQEKMSHNINCVYAAGKSLLVQGHRRHLNTRDRERVSERERERERWRERECE
jgi:hypothetical protein